MTFLSTLDPLVAFVAGAAALGVVAVPVVIWLGRQRTAAAKAYLQLEAETIRKSETLEAAPDGLFHWDLRNREEVCSRRLAVLLNLERGTQSRFADMLARFSGAEAKTLGRAVMALHQDGTAFDFLLPYENRLLHMVGVRSGTAEGEPLTDLLWVRDVTAAAASAAVPEAEPAAIGEATEERDRFWALLDALPFPVWLRDSALKLAFTNRAGAGASDSDAAMKMAAKARKEGRACNESHLLTVDGSPRLFDITETPIEGWAGTMGFAIDRSAAEEMEGEHARHAAARDQVLETLATAIAIFGADTRLKFFNTAYAKLWRLNANWLATEPLLSEVLDRLREKRRLPEFADFGKFRDDQLAQFNTVSEPEESLMHLPDGATLRTLVSPHATGGLVFAFEDVTDRLDLERSYNTLAAVQGETLDNLFEGIAVFGSDGRLKLSNPVFARIWGFTEEELAAEPHMADFVEKTGAFIVSHRDWQSHKEAVIKRLTGREPSSGRLMRTDGMVLDYANLPLPDGAVLTSYLDVTDSVRVELALRDRAEALQEADRLKSEFIANVSYEIRNPLNSIIGFAEILANEDFGELNRRQMEYSRGILTASQGLTSVVNDILDLATIEAGMMTLELDTVDIHSMMVSLVGLVRETAKRKKLEIKFQCPPDIGWIVADEKRLKQVLFNLLANAVNFISVGGVVTLIAERRDGSVVLAVRDQGSGASEDKNRSAFQNLGKGGPPEVGQGGAGLGLSLVRRFIELHGGHVEVKSQPGKGATVYCFLPTSGVQDESRTA